MEERGQSNSTGQHKLILQNRKSGSFTGVTDVVNFDANEIILDTELGRLYAREAKEQENPAQFLAEKEAEYTKLFANPYNAAKYGYIDDVIEPRNTRFRVIRALQQLQTKKLTNPAKKHGNIPL